MTFQTFGCDVIQGTHYLFNSFLFHFSRSVVCFVFWKTLPYINLENLRGYIANNTDSRQIVSLMSSLDDVTAKSLKGYKKVVSEGKIHSLVLDYSEELKDSYMKKWQKGLVAL